MSNVAPLRPKTATHHDGREGTIDPQTGGLWVPTSEGGLELADNWRTPESESKSHTGNLAIGMDSVTMGALADEVCRGIEADYRSGAEYRDMTAEAVLMLGIKLYKPGEGGTDAPMEGMSSVRNPLLLDCVIGFQSDTMGEMLPASGPAKIRNDGDERIDPLADALEQDFNHYLTVTATEYYPDTDRGLFSVGHIGGIVKKVYTCARRKRPVSECVYLKDIIVNSEATDLDNAIRVTHQTTIIAQDLQAMIDEKIYAPVALGSPVYDPDVVTRAGAEQLGVQLSQPELDPDRPHTIWECYTKKKLFDDEEASPYRITVDKDSRQILEIRRNWEEDDKTRKPLKVFVMWPYLLTSLGFYPLGLFHLLCNTNMALTACWRMGQDASMYGNFPGFLYAEGFGKQQTNLVRVPPGSGAPVQTNGQPIQQVVMPLPYKGLEATMIPWIEQMQAVGQKLGGRAEIQVGEGRQDAPVGTTLAMIEQAMKPVAAVAKRLHTAQAEEFKLLLRLFRKDPEAFWRDNPSPAHPWDEQKLLAALDQFDLVPVSDPNTPSQMHRVAKALMVFQMAQAAPTLFEPPVTAKWLLSQIKVDPVAAGLKTPEKYASDMAAQQQAMAQQAGAQGKTTSPAELASKEKIAGMKAQSDQTDAQLKLQEQAAEAATAEKEIQARAQEALVESQDRAADRASTERIAELHLAADREKTQAGLASDAADRQHQAGMAQQAQAHEETNAAADRAHESVAAQTQMAHDSDEGERARLNDNAQKMAGLGSATQET
jgi:hypothetical protein